MSILSKIFGFKNPADSAMPYLNQIPGIGQQYYDPFVQSGRTAGTRLEGEYDQLLSDPNAFIDKIMSGYEPSKGFQFQKDLLSKALGSTAAAGGYRGTDFDQLQQGEAIQGLLSKDMQQYLQNVLGAYKTGLEGEQDIYDKGFQASGSLADYLGSALGQQGQVAFQGQAQKNANKAGLFKLLAQALGGAAGLGGLGGLGSLATGGLGSSMFGGG